MLLRNEKSLVFFSKTFLWQESAAEATLIPSPADSEEEKGGNFLYTLLRHAASLFFQF